MEDVDEQKKGRETIFFRRRMLFLYIQGVLYVTGDLLRNESRATKYYTVTVSDCEQKRQNMFFKEESTVFHSYHHNTKPVQDK